MVSPAEPQKKGSLAILEEGDRATTATRHAEISDEPAAYLTPQEELENTSKGSASTPSTKEGDASSEGAVPGAALGEKDSSAADLRYRKRQIGRENTQGEGLGGPYAGPPRRATQISTTSSGEPRMGITRTFTQLLQPEHRLAPALNTYHSLLNILKYSWLNVLLVFIPVSWALHFALPKSTTNDVVIFVTSFLAIIPLAALLSFGTEEIALRVGETLGGLINATLGNAVELIVAIIALFQCQLTIVQTSLIGSILSNTLLVLGTCFLLGGLRFKEQTFGVQAAQLNSSLLLMSVIAALLPAGFHVVLGAEIADNIERPEILQISRGVAVILLLIYLSYIYFTLFSHKHLYASDEDEEEPQLNIYCAIGLLILATVLVGVTSEWLVDSINGVTEAPGGPSPVFIGGIILPIVGNAAEHATALIAAVKRKKLDLSMAVAVGSSIQVALFILPLTILIAWMANKPLSMLYDPFVSLILFLSILIVNSAIGDGVSNYLEGIVLVSLFVVIALMFWFVGASPDALFTDEYCRTGVAAAMPA